MYTIRELIIQDLLARLPVCQASSPDSGYYTLVGTHVFRAKTPVEKSYVPYSVLFPYPETAEAKFGKLLCKMKIVVNGIAAFGNENPSEISERILGDIIKAMTDPTWWRSLSPNYIESIDYIEGGTEEYPEPASVLVGSRATFIVSYFTSKGDPYSS